MLAMTFVVLVLGMATAIPILLVLEIMSRRT
jgi:hypothetical protein